MILDGFGAWGEFGWPAVCGGLGQLDERRKYGGPLAGLIVTGRGGVGSKVHLVIDWIGLSLSLGICGVSMCDGGGLGPVVRGIRSVGSAAGWWRRRLVKLHAGWGYDEDGLCWWPRCWGVLLRVARDGVGCWQRLGGSLGGRCNGFLAGGLLAT